MNNLLRLGDPRRMRWAACFALAISTASACHTETPAPAAVSPKMTFTSAAMSADFYASPFPSDTRMASDGTVDLHGYPLPSSPNIATVLVGMLDRKAHGFGTTSGIFFELTGALRESDLPHVQGSVAPSSPIALVSVDSSAPDYLQRYPVSAKFFADAGPYGAKNLLTLLPLQGVPLRPHTRYAAVLLSQLHDASGKALAPSAEMKRLATGARPDGMSDTAWASYSAALAALPSAKIPLASVVGLTVFTTDSPTADFDKVANAMLAAPIPAPISPFTKNETFDDYCVYSTTIAMPEYQEGTPPYTGVGGDWVFDESGAPVLARMETASFVVTIPRAPMPATGYPIVVFSRTGGGGDRPLVDRGPQAMTSGPPITPGMGPAYYFAKAGFAGSSIDGPHGGLRNVTHEDEQFLMFNVGNPPALRDNVRQSAAELVLEAHILDGVSIDITGCPGASAPNGKATFDAGMMAIMGHSMGATISPLALAFEPRFRAGLLSGAGGSWIENVMYKLHPLPVEGFAELLVGYTNTPYHLSEWDPILSMFQWALEPADPPVFGARVIREPTSGHARNVLMMQGIVDHYILPPIANATSLSFGLDLAGAELDDKAPELSMMASFGSLVGLVGHKSTSLPAASNVENGAGDTVTAVLTQHPEDGIEDGHEVVFQTDAPKHEYRCFLEGLKTGAPRVPSPGAALDPCD